MILNTIEHVDTILCISIVFTIKECVTFYIIAKLQLHKSIVYFLIYIYIYIYKCLKNKELKYFFIKYFLTKIVIRFFIINIHFN